MFFLEIDINSTTHYISTSSFGGTNRFWSPMILNEVSFSISSTTSGGYVKPSWGSFTFDSALFVGDWPPPLSCDVIGKYGLDDSTSSQILDGTLILKQFDASKVTYEVWEKSYDDNLLIEITNYDGDTVANPMCFGNVTHALPVRIADYSGYHQYRKPTNLASGYTVYDDGVDVTANVTDSGNNFYFDGGTPVGQVTVSGSSLDTAIEDVFDWIATNRLTGVSMGFSQVAINNIFHVQYSQIKTLDFLDKLAWFFNYRFYLYVNGATTYLGLRRKYTTINPTTYPNDVHTLDFKFLPLEYNVPTPIRKIETSYTTRSRAGYQLVETTVPVVALGNYSFGEDITTDCYTTNSPETALAPVVSGSTKVHMKLKMPVNLGIIPKPTDEISFVDTRLVTSTNVTMWVGGVSYDFGNEDSPDIIVVNGEGDLSI